MSAAGAVVVVVDGGMRAELVRDTSRNGAHESGADELVRLGCSCAVAAKAKGAAAELVEGGNEAAVMVEESNASDVAARAMASEDAVVLLRIPRDTLRNLDALLTRLLTGARECNKLIVLLVESGISAGELLHRPHEIVPQSWRFEDGVRQPDALFARSYICVQYCEHRTRVDDKSSLADFYDDDGIAIPPGMGGGAVNAAQLGKEIAFTIGRASKYGS